MNEDALFPPGSARMLSPKAVTLWRLSLHFWSLALAGGIVLVGSLAGRASAAWLVGGTIFVAGLVLAALWPPARYRHWSFAVSDDDVVIRRGVLWRATSVIPHARIQHVDTTHGPLERRLGLSSVVIFTAGTTGASITIPALPADEGEKLRDQLARLGRAGEAV